MMYSVSRTVSLFSSLCLLIAGLINQTAAGQNLRGLQVVKDTSASTTAQHASAYGNQYALVIGVNAYVDQGLPDLQYAVSDAEAIAGMLVDTYGFPEKNVVLLRNEEASRTRILNEMQRFIAAPEIEEDSQFLFFFAGHGETIRNQIGFILPHDVDLDNLVASGIRMNEIGDMARALKPKHALFLMDACYGGLSALRSTQKSAVMLKNALSSKARQLLTAGSADEQVLEASEYQHSAFTFALLDALKEGSADGNHDGIISALELATKIQYDVPFYADVHGGKQTPQYTKLTPDAGDFLFIRDAAALANIDLMDENTILSDQEDIAKSFQKKLQIRANVDNARIFVNDVERGYLTDKQLVLPLSAGIYTIAIKKDQYEEASQDIVISPRDSLASIEFDLESTHAAVHFDVQPPDAIVYVDNDYAGAGTFWEYVSKGRKRIEVSKEGYVTDIRTANITQDSLLYEVRLEQIEATLNLTTIPIGTLVTTSSDTLGVTPLRNVTIPYGNHDIVVRREGYDDYHLPLQITESSIINRHIELTETAEVVARRMVNRERGKNLKGFLTSGLFGVGAYVGHNYLNSELSNLEEDADERQPYQIATYATLGLAGIFGVVAVSKLFRLALVDYDKTLEKELERRARTQLTMGHDGRQFTVAMRLNF